MKFDDTKRGYENLWAKAMIRPEKKAIVLARARRIAAEKARYQALEVRTTVPWWWIAIAHNLEAGGDFNRYLGNGQVLSRRTTIVPIGRGPFVSFEAGAVDAINIKGLQRIGVWTIPRALFHWEQFNGFGYVSKRINSPYVWSMTNLYDRGKFVADHVFDPNAVSAQIGGAAMLLGLIEIGAVSFETEGAMTELANALSPFAGLVPHLVRAIAGPLPSIAVRALAEVLDVTADPATVKTKLEDKPLSELVAALQRAEELVQTITVPATPPVRAEEPPVVAAPTQTAAPAQPTGPLVVQPVKPEPSAIDKATGGWLTGWKTILGIVIYCGAYALGQLGYLDPATANAISTAGAGLAGVGLIAKVERWLPLFAGFLRVVKR